MVPAELLQSLQTLQSLKLIICTPFAYRPEAGYSVGLLLKNCQDRPLRLKHCFDSSYIVRYRSGIAKISISLSKCNMRKLDYIAKILTLPDRRVFLGAALRTLALD